MIKARAALAAIAALAVSLGCPGDEGGVGNVLVVASVEVTPGITTVILGGTTQLTAAPKTASGLPVPGRAVTWSSTDAAKASVSQTGLVTGMGLGGPIRIRATVDGVTGDALITVQPVPVDHIGVTPPNTPILVGGTVQLTATAFDAANTPLTGRSFLWESSAPTTAAVTSTGMVIGQSEGGPVTITARTEGKTGSATVSVSTRPATRLAFATQPGPSTAGAPFNPQIRIALQDDLLTTVIGASNPVTIELAGNPGGATLGGTLTASPTNGIATFGNLTINRVGAGYTFLVTSPGLVSATSQPFSVSPGPAAQFTFTTAPPGAAQSGVALSPQPVLQLRDGSGNVVQLANLLVTATLASGTGTLGGTVTATTNAQGVATFTNLAIVGAAGSYTLGFSAPSIATLLSGPIVLGSGAATALSITTQPSPNAQNAAPLVQQPAVQLRDGAGNPVSQAGVVITASLASGTGSLGGATTATTNASGLATFTSLAINGVAGVYTIRFSAPGGITPVVSGSITLGAGTGSRIVVTVQPGTPAQVGVPFSPQPAVQIRDASNNPVATAGVTITASASAGGTLIGLTTATTDATGTATFTGLGLSGLAGPYTLAFSAAQLQGGISNTVTLIAGAASQLSITTQPSGGAASGVVFGQQPVIQVQDIAGNPVGTTPGVMVTAAIASGPAGTLGGTPTATTTTSGVASFTNLAITGPSGGYTIRFTSPGLTQVVSSTVTLGSGIASIIAISTQPSAAAQSGAVFGQQPATLVLDAASNPVPGVVVTATITGAPAGVSLIGTLTATSDPSGLATFVGLGLGGSVGNYTLTFTAGALSSNPSNTIVLSAGTATQLSYNQQPSTTATSGIAFAQQPILLLRDASSNPVASTVVTATVTGAPAGVSLIGTVTATTNASGLATFVGLGLNGAPGVYTLTFVSGAATSPVSSAIALSAGTATQLTYNTQPSVSASSGASFATAPVLLLRDGANNPVGSTVVTATITGTPAGVSFVGTASATTTASGLATFTGLGMSGPVGTYTLTFTSGTVTSAASNPIALGAGAATQLTYTQQPSSTANSGQAFGQQPILLLRDAANNPIATTVVTATITGAPVGVSLVGTVTATTNASGIATFVGSGLGLSGAVGSYTLTFTAGAVLSTASNAIALSAGSATQLTYNTQPPGSATSGAAFATAPVLLLRDAANNPVGSTIVTATITGSPAGVSFVGTATATTNGSGLATFAGLGLSGPAGNYSLTFTAGVVTSIASNAIALSAGGGTQLTYTQQPSTTATSGQAFAQQPILLLRDASSNPVGSAVITATITGSPAGAALIGTVTATTNGSGIATFVGSGLGLSALVGNYTLTFTSGAATSVASNTIALSAGTATQLTYSTQPPVSATSGAAFGTAPVLLLRDAANNPIGSTLVTATITGSPAGVTFVGTTTATTNGSGLATFTGLGLNGPTGNYTLTFTAGAITSAASNAIALSAGGGTQLTYNQQPSATANSGQAFAQQPILLLLDASNNPVGSALVTAAITGSPAGASLVGTVTVTTNGAGIATFVGSGLGINGPVGSYTLTFTSGAASSAPSNTIVLSAGTATQLTYTTQPSTTATSGTAFAQQPVLLLRDAANNPVGSTAITATITGSPAGVSFIGTTIVNTNASGVASFVGTGLGLSGPVGNYTLTFTAGAVTSAASNTIALGAGTGTQLTYTQQPSTTANSGQAFPLQPILLLRDASNNPVGSAVVTATITGSPAGASLVGTTTATTDGAGIATFVGSGLGINGPVGNYTLTFTSGAATSVASITIALSAGTATQLTYNTQPSTTANSGQAFGAQPVLLLRDAASNPVGSTVVTATITGAPAGASLVGTATATTNGSGLATFSGLGLSGPVGNYTLTFTSGAASSAPSNTIVLSAGTPTQLTYNTQPSTTANSGQAFGTQPMLLLRDAANNPIGSTLVTATITGAPAGVTFVGTPSATTNGSGLATFSGLGLSGPVGNYTLTFTAGAVTSAASNTIALSAGTATQLTYNTQPSPTANSGQAFGTQPVLLLRDAADNPVGSTLVTATITGAPAGVSFVGTPSVTTNGSGLATFSGLGLSGPVGNYTLTFTAGVVTSAASNTIALSAGTPTQVTYNTQPSTTANSGQAFGTQPVVLLRDGGNNPIGSTLVTATITGSPAGVSFVGTPTATTDGSGLATFSGLGLSGPVGNYTLTFTSGAAISVASNTIALSAGTPTQLTYNTQPSTTANSGQAFGTQPVLLLRDAANNPISSTLVTATITGAPAGVTFVGTPSATTNGSGLATFSGLGLSGPVGNYTLTFTAGVVTSAASNTIALSAGSPTQLTYNTQPSTTANSGQAFGTQPVLMVLDAANNPVGSTLVTATITGAPAGASLVGTATATTDGSGVATFVGSGLGLSALVGNYTLTFISGAATSTPSNTIALSAGTPTQLTYNTQPSTTANSGQAFGTQPVVLLRDGGNNPIGSTLVTATITGSPAGVSFVGTPTATTDGSGLATFSGLGLSGPVGNYTLTFTVGAVTSAASSTIALSAGTPTQLTYNTQPSTTANSGQAFVQQPVLLLRDAANNPISSTLVTATITGAPAGVSFVGTPSATTNGSGLATFSGLGLSGPVGNYTLTFTAGVVTSAASNTIALSAGTPTQVTYNTQPSTTANSGQAFGTQPVLLLRDAANNPVGSTLVTATITGAPAGVSLMGTATATTDGSGLATFVGLGLDGLVGSYTLTFTSGAATSAASNTIVLSAGTPAQIIITQQPGPPGVVFGTLSPQPIVQVQDAFGNVVSGITVTATLESGAGSLNGTASVVTDGNGNATYTDLGILLAGSGNHKLRFTLPAFPSVSVITPPF